ncbi:MAG TPA: hypothetical protein ENN43_06005, partial [bacterium]|nr:hypothetical protein [bacterium]
MAKKKKKSVKKAAAFKKAKAVAASVKAKVESLPAPAKPKSNKIPLIILTIVVFLLVGAQIVFVINKQVQANKKPVLVNSWKVQYGIQAGMPVSG